MQEVRYAGAGTRENPYIVDWDRNDPENPYNWPKRRKWLITSQLAISTWTVSFGSSAYSGGLRFTESMFHVSEEVAVLGISLYVLGFGLGPLVFAPLGEMYGRRRIFLITMSVYTLMHLGGALGHNIATLLSTRFLAGVFGSSPLTNAGGAISDIWNPRERGVATSLYATAPWLGPVIGPIVGGFVSQTPSLGWRFSFWIMMIVSGVTLIYGFLVTPETYAPVLLRRRARMLEKGSGGLIHYVSKYEIHHSASLFEKLQINLSRPFLFLFTEPIVTLLSIYVCIAYSTLYAFFAAFPIVFQQHRHFTPGNGGLAFLGVGVGTIIGTCMTPIQNRMYWRAMDRSPTGRAPPEARLYLMMGVAGLLPVGLFWFAWTSQPSVHWMLPVAAGVPFGTGCAQVMQGITAYLMDAYHIYFASAIAATVVLRSMGAFAFPLFCPLMYKKLGDQWACSVFGFLALLCTPMPYLFYVSNLTVEL
ncbi:MFS general substrate transporter [Gloeophyllum trabeum ATCC 11539]|uniref:MFS general substrate transporter n=1 Tax=Gloeophyllum trabeum (strain ATCC 11539 / FP-39264 / Madison 617) TaxID=670483 RepID=S7QGF0_GLOTA|nr:MFS general substrate transporter [Gloeophyllum trabeum ATCC 11539]EPQ58477.1 MFS general substrate transporter [Gloeophyllum trabeum ATCC 11539]